MQRANHQIGLPIAVALSAFNDGGAQIDRDSVGNGATPLAHTAPFAPLLVGPECQMQSPAGALVLVDALIDGLVGKAQQMLGALIAGNLLRAPSLGQLLDGKLPHGGVHAASVGGALLAAGQGQQSGHLRLIKVENPVAVQLAADARDMPPQPGCDGPL